MDTGTATGPESWRTGQDLLTELYFRTRRVKSQLNDLFSGQKKYFYKTSEAIIDAFDLPTDKADMLRDFSQKLINCLDKARQQVQERLKKLILTLESYNVKVELTQRGTKTLHVRPEGAIWHVRAHFRKTWIFSMPIDGVSAEAEFPDILSLSSQDLYYLQAGWRASDEGDSNGIPSIGTTKPWQVFAWSAVRFGNVSIYLRALNLNVTKPTLEWNITSKSWKQEWPTREGKALAKKEAENSVLGYLAFYLGDGEKHRDSLRFAVGDSDKYMPRYLAKQVVNAGYASLDGYISYGSLLDLLQSDKWLTLKKLSNLQQVRNPIYATFQGHSFWLYLNEDDHILQARTLFKDPSEAEKLAKALADIGIQARIYTWRKYGYHILQITGQNILKLAENSPEWRKALRQLAQKRDLQPKTPMLRRLLELAENPPLPIKNLNPSRHFFFWARGSAWWSIRLINLLRYRGVPGSNPGGPTIHPLLTRLAPQSKTFLSSPQNK